MNFSKYLIEKFGVLESDLPSIYELIKIKKISAGSFLLKPGEICNNTFFVEKGLLRLYSLSENGKDNILQFASENWLLRDRDSVFFKVTSKFYIEAIKNSHLIPMDDKILSKIAELAPGFRKKNEILDAINDFKMGKFGYLEG